MFLDFGLGILAAIISCIIFSVDLTIGLLIFSVLVAVLPDVDFLYFYPKREDTKYDHIHRNFIHYPLLYLPLGVLITFIFFGSVWAVAFFLSSLFHFIHDSIGIGWGIKWLYPFSKKNYAFFYLYSRRRKKGLRKLIFSFDDEEQKRCVRKHGDPNWVKNIYFKGHPIAIVEFIGFIISLIILLAYVQTT